MKGHNDPWEKIMNILKSKKFIIIIIVVIVIALLVFKFQIHAKQNLEDYNKYCIEDCNDSKVTNKELKAVITKREEVAIANIKKNIKSIDDTTAYLKKKKLTTEESKKLENIKVDSKYDSSKDYNIDELIVMETNYKTMSKQIEELKTEVRIRTLTKSIVANNKKISSIKKDIKSYELTSKESSKLKKLNEQLTYDEKNEYTVKELTTINQTYADLVESYNTLLSSIKDRVISENQHSQSVELDADTSLETESTYDSLVDETSTNNTTDYVQEEKEKVTNESPQSNNVESNNNTKETNNNEAVEDPEEPAVMPSYCYASEDEAWAAGEAFFSNPNADNPNNYSGFGAYPGCGGNMSWWEIDWF